MRLPGDPTVYRFILVGIVNTLFGTAIMFVFYNVFHLSYWRSSASNYFFGSILSYFLNKSFTFRYGKTDFRSIFRFTVNILVCYLLAYGIAKPVMRHLLSGYSVSIQENVSMALGMVLFVGLNYLGQRFFAFFEQPGVAIGLSISTYVGQNYGAKNLKRIRTFFGCTQAELAKRSGVSLRSIQMYEQRNKDINKASAESLYRISKVLGCTIEDLLEK